MFILRSKHESAIAKERERVWDLAKSYGDALHRVTALQQEMSAWVTNKADNITPEQAAAMFYAQDDSWQAAFFNVMQDVVQAHHDAQPPALPGSYNPGPGYPAGESQWCWMAGKLNDSGFETLEAMFDHARHARERAAEEAAA